MTQSIMLQALLTADKAEFHTNTFNFQWTMSKQCWWWWNIKYIMKHCTHEGESSVCCWTLDFSFCILMFTCFYSCFMHFCLFAAHIHGPQRMNRNLLYHSIFEAPLSPDLCNLSCPVLSAQQWTRSTLHRTSTCWCNHGVTNMAAEACFALFFFCCCDSSVSQCSR